MSASRKSGSKSESSKKRNSRSSSSESSEFYQPIPGPGYSKQKKKRPSISKSKSIVYSPELSTPREEVYVMDYRKKSKDAPEPWLSKKDWEKYKKGHELVKDVSRLPPEMQEEISKRVASVATRKDFEFNCLQLLRCEDLFRTPLIKLIENDKYFKKYPVLKQPFVWEFLVKKKVSQFANEGYLPKSVLKHVRKSYNFANEFRFRSLGIDDCDDYAQEISFFSILYETYHFKDYLNQPGKIQMLKRLPATAEKHYGHFNFFPALFWLYDSLHQPNLSSGSTRTRATYENLLSMCCFYSLLAKLSKFPMFDNVFSYIKTIKEVRIRNFPTETKYLFPHVFLSNVFNEEEQRKIRSFLDRKMKNKDIKQQIRILNELMCSDKFNSPGQFKNNIMLKIPSRSRSSIQRQSGS